MNRSNANVAALLKTTMANVVMCQEPYWGPIIPSRSDKDPNSTPLSGTINHLNWEVYNPPPNEDVYPHIATFIRKDISRSCQIIIEPLLLSYHSISILISNEDTRLRLINFYHHVTDHHPNLDNLLQANLDPLTPLILGGDFNTHSELWSPGDIRPSPWADDLELWLDQETLCPWYLTVV